MCIRDSDHLWREVQSSGRGGHCTPLFGKDSLVVRLLPQGTLDVRWQRNFTSFIQHFPIKETNPNQPSAECSSLQDLDFIVFQGEFTGWLELCLLYTSDAA